MSLIYINEEDVCFPWRFNPTIIVWPTTDIIHPDIYVSKTTYGSHILFYPSFVKKKKKKYQKDRKKNSLHFNQISRVIKIEDVCGSDCLSFIMVWIELQQVDDTGEWGIQHNSTTYADLPNYYRPRVDR